MELNQLLRIIVSNSIVAILKNTSRILIKPILTITKELFKFCLQFFKVNLFSNNHLQAERYRYKLAQNTVTSTLVYDYFFRHKMLRYYSQTE